MEKEVWKPLSNSIYEASNIGRIRRVDSYIGGPYGCKRFWKGRIIKTPIADTGYLYFNESVNGKPKPKNVHIAVWEAFNGEIPKGYDVHHKNGIKTDNRLENLELIDLHKHRTYHNSRSGCKKVEQYTLNGEFVTEYPSAMEAARQNGYSQGCISECCRGECESRYGFKWKYKEVAAACIKG